MPVRYSLLAFALGILASGLEVISIHAATASASLSVSATVQASCLAVVAKTTVKAYGAAAGAASAVSVACNNLAPYSVSLDATKAPDATLELPQIIGSGFDRPDYALNSDLRHATHWREVISTDAATRIVSRSTLESAIRSRFSERRAAFDAEADTIIVVVTF